MMACAEQKTPGTAGRRRLTALAAAVGLSALVLTGCGGQGGGRGAAASSAEAGAQAGSGETTLRVSAAAYLTQSFDELAEEFEQDHPGVSVDVNYGGSSGLVQQLTEGALSLIHI